MGIECVKKLNKEGVTVHPDLFVYITLAPVLFLGVIDHGLSPLQQHWIEQFRLNLLSMYAHDAVPVFVGDKQQKASRKPDAGKVSQAAGSSSEEEDASTSSDEEDSEADWG